MALISVIVPVYNVEPYLHRCVDSILGQTFTDFELILVDDGSPDNCPAICDHYAKIDSRVVVIHQENGGLSAARNAAIDWVFANSDSEWLTFIDSDDWVHTDYLKCLYDSAAEHNVLLSQCGSQDLASEDSIVLPTAPYTARLVTPSELYVMRGAVTAMRKLIHRSLMKDIRFPLGKLHEDEFTTYLFVFAVEHAVVVDHADFYYYWLRQDSIMRAPYTPKHLDVIRAYENQLSFFKSRELHDMEQYCANNFIDNIARQYRQCQSVEFENKKETLKGLRKKLVDLIIKYQRKLNLSVKNFPAVFEVAFPRMMYLYWTCLGIAQKMKRGKKSA